MHRDICNSVLIAARFIIEKVKTWLQISINGELAKLSLRNEIVCNHLEYKMYEKMPNILRETSKLQNNTITEMKNTLEESVAE